MILKYVFLRSFIHACSQRSDKSPKKHEYIILHLSNAQTFSSIQTFHDGGDKYAQAQRQPRSGVLKGWTHINDL